MACYPHCSHDSAKQRLGEGGVVRLAPPPALSHLQGSLALGFSLSMQIPPPSKNATSSTKPSRIHPRRGALSLLEMLVLNFPKD